MPYGTLTISDLLASTQQSIAEVGEQKVFDAINASNMAHNTLLSDKVSMFVERGTDRQKRYGGPDAMVMEELDELGASNVQKVVAGFTVGFPLRFYGLAVQWDRFYMEQVTPAEMAAQFTAAQDADITNLDRAIRRALLGPTNYTFTDRLVDNVDIPVKALLNGDSAPVPVGPNGETFNAATHTHYVGRVGGAVAATDVSLLIENVTEHYGNGQVMLLINRAQEATIRSYTSNFTGYVDGRILTGANVTRANGTLNQSNLYDRAIGIFDQAEVWVKPWVPSGYMVAIMTGVAKPLYMREPLRGAAGFNLLADNETFPLRARQLGRRMGIGVWNRHSAAALYIGGTSYVAPAIV